MRRALTLLPAMLLALTGAASADNGRPAPKFDPLQQTKRALEADPAIKFDPGSVLVRFNPDVPELTKDAIRAVVGGEVITRYTLVPGLEHLRVAPDSERASDILKMFQAAVMYAEPDQIVHNCVTPNDPNFTLLWGLNNTGQTVNGDPGINNADINAPEAWDITTGSASFIIADIDTGANYNHPDLGANIWTNPGEIPGNGIDDERDGYIDDVRGYDFYNNDGDPIDDNGHGTHTAGTIGALGNNGVGVTGVNWQCSIMPLKFLNAQGSGSTSGAISSLNFAVNHGVKVSNNSWGSTGFSQSLSDAITSARTAGHIVVCAAGNAGTNNDSSPFYPASYAQDNVVSVAATDNNDNRASFSNYGATSVDLGAPGVTILSTYGSGYAYLDGTSMATPHVTGVIALVWGRNTGLTYSQVRQQVLSTVRPLTALQGITVTGGILNAFAAVGGGGGANTAPTVTISSPANGQTFTAGTSVTFTGSASDVQDGNISASLVWTSSLQGQIGTGASFPYANLVVGTHIITASVTDSGSLTGSAPVTITIQSVGPQPPAAPSNLTAVRGVSSGTAVLSWSDNSGDETNFEIQRERKVGGGWTGLTTISVGANTTTYIDSPLPSGNFHWRIRAVNGAGASAYTAWFQLNVR